MTPEALQPFLGNHVKVTVDQEALDFLKAKEIAKTRAKEFAPDPMLLSWYNGKSGEYYPRYGGIYLSFSFAYLNPISISFLLNGPLRLRQSKF
ncbi:MAG: AF1514 family protein [Desulfobacterales bacterium]